MATLGYLGQEVDSLRQRQTHRGKKVGIDRRERPASMRLPLLTIQRTIGLPVAWQSENRLCRTCFWTRKRPRPTAEDPFDVDAKAYGSPAAEVRTG